MTTMGSALSRERLATFLQGKLLARVALVTPSCEPYVVPVWYHWDGQALWFVGRERSEWCLILDHSSAMAAVIDAEGEYSVGNESFFSPRATFRGAAEVVERPGTGNLWIAIGRLMASRYRGQAGLDYFDSTLADRRWLVKLRTTHITSWEGGGWASRYRAAR